MRVKDKSEKSGLKLNIQKTKIMASDPITSWRIDGETVTDFIFLGSKITADSDCSHRIKRRLLLGKPDCVLKSRDITLPTKVCVVKAMVFPVKEKKVKSLSRVRLFDPMDCSLPGSSIHGIFQARILEWVTISFSRRSSRPQGLKRGLLHCRQMLYRLSHMWIGPVWVLKN